MDLKRCSTFLLPFILLQTNDIYVLLRLCLIIPCLLCLDIPLIFASTFLLSNGNFHPFPRHCCWIHLEVCDPRARGDIQDCSFCTSLFSSTIVIFPHLKTYTRSAAHFFDLQSCLFWSPSCCNLSFVCHPLSPFHFACRFQTLLFSGLGSWEDLKCTNARRMSDHTSS